MQIKIHNETIEYISDFPHGEGWKRQNDPYAFFKFPVTLGNTQVFIKRFERLPRAYDFLAYIKNQTAYYLPIVFDFQKTIETVDEQAIDVYYLFEEYIPGIKLREAIIGKGVDIDFRQMAKDLWESLEELHKYNIWHTDFCEENIILSEDQRFCLIDFDSGDTTKSSIDLQYVVFKEYNAIALSAFKKIDPVFTIQDISGEHLNMIELLVMLSYYKSIALGEVTYQSLGMEKTIEQIKNNIPNFEAILKTALHTKLGWNDFEEILNGWFGSNPAIFFISGITNLPEEQMPGASLAPEEQAESIYQFDIPIPTIELTLNGYSKQSFTGLPKDTIRLSWHINNATRIEAGLIEKKTQTYQKVNFIKEFGEMDFELLNSETLVIEAINESSSGETKITRREVEFIVKVPALALPDILSFEIDGSTKDKCYVKAMQTVMFSWKVRNANFVQLNDIEYDVSQKNTLNIQVEENTFFELVAINRRGIEEKKSQPKHIQVKVRKEIPVPLAVVASTPKVSHTIAPVLEPVVVPSDPSLAYLLINGIDQRMISLTKGSPIKIAWKFQHTSSITINGDTYEAEGSFDIPLTENLTYFFRAGNIYETVIISVIEPKALALPKINEFSINALQDAQLTISHGHPLMMKWQVADAHTVSLFKNGEEITLNQNTGQMSLEQLLQGSKNQAVNLILKAKNKDGKAVTISKQLTVKSKPKLSPILITLIVLGIIILLINLAIILF